MGEAILKHRFQMANLSITVSSAGIAALEGKSADLLVQELLLPKGIDCSSHRARQLTSPMLLEAELVLAMEQRHCKEIEYMFPSVCGKVHRLGKWDGFDIPDPYKKSKQVFMETYQLIVQGIDQWQERLWK
jgi:protein-tyrosine phosphatase